MNIVLLNVTVNVPVTTCVSFEFLCPYVFAAELNFALPRKIANLVEIPPPMKGLFVSLLVVFTVFSCGREKTEKSSDDFVSSDGADLQSVAGTGDMSIDDAEGHHSQALWEYYRFRNPETGEIPENIRKRELAFAKTLPANTKRAWSWDNRGPYNIGGRTRALGIDVLNENIWIAGGVTGGIWRSTDAGASWEKVTTQTQIHSVASIVQDTRPGHQATWYAGTGEYYLVVSHATYESRFSGNGIMKSTDNGLTWTELPSTQSFTPETTYESDGDFDYVWKLVVDESDLANDVVLAAVFNGIYRSDDGGTSWTQVHGFEIGAVATIDCDMLDLVATDDGVFFATYSSDGVGKGVYRSDDGITWAEITPAIYPSAYGRMVMALNPLNDSIVWFFGDTNGPFAAGHSVFRYEYLSGDGSGAGGSWQDRSQYLPHQSCYVSEISFELGYLNTQSSFDVAIGIHPTDTNTIFIAGTSIWRNKDAFTHDSTNSWIGGYFCDPLPYDDVNWKTSYPGHHPDQHSLQFLPSDNSKMVNTNDGGIYVTQDCMSDSVFWDSKNNGYVTTQFYAVAIEPGQTTDDKIVGGMQDNSTWLSLSPDPDSAWHRVTGGDGMFCAITETADYYLGCTQNGKLFLYTLDATGQITAFERIDPEGGPSAYNWANRYILDPNSPHRVYWNGRTKLWRLDDVADIVLSGDKTNKEPDHWVSINESATSGPSGVITDIELCKSWINTVWYGTSQGSLFRLNYADDDAAAIKTNLTGDNFPPSCWVSSVAVNPDNADEILVCFANYEVPSIFQSTDGGQTWIDISGNLEENPDGSGSGPSALWVEYYPDGTLFVGTTTGLYTTSDPDGAATTWLFEPGIGNVVINMMDYRTFDGRFVVGTHGLGVFSTNVQAVNVGVEENETDILSVFPSPANDLITITANPMFDTYTIFDLSGRPLLHEKQTGKTQQLSVTDLSAGTYLLVAYGSGKREVRKFVVN